MKALLTLFFVLCWLTLAAQLEDAEVFLKAAWEKELALQSGEVNIRIDQYHRDSLISQSENKVIFLHEPGNNGHLCILENGKEGVYFSQGETFEYHYRGFRRQWPNPLQDEYKWRVLNSFEDLSLGFYPELKVNRPYNTFLYEREKNGDSVINWDPLTRTLSIKIIEINRPQMYVYRICDFEFTADQLLFRATETTYNIYPTLTFVDKIIRNYAYSRMDQIPYFQIRQRLKEYQNAPLLSVTKPEEIEIKRYPDVGMSFPDLMLMDGIGRTKNLHSLSGPKILIFAFSPLHSDLSVFSFVDSMEDAHPGWTFMLITQTSIDQLDEYQRLHPTITSFYLASKVEGLELNGWPIWFILNKEGVVLAENHGYQPYRNKEFDEWIKDHIGGE
ncbi:MAG: TlpA family protein disulfide reductase [Bacteroidia bacterium]